MSHKKKVTAMVLSKDGRYLISGDAQGLMYIWNIQTEEMNMKDSENGPSLPLCTLELHKDKGAITNLVAITRPLSLFGLTSNMKNYNPGELKPL
jgi:WD40 repeat protein